LLTRVRGLVTAVQTASLDDSPQPGTPGQPGGREDAQRLVRDLPAMDIQRAYHLHRDLLELQEADRAAGGNVLASSQ
jgi:hypothetical protein